MKDTKIIETEGLMENISVDLLHSRLDYQRDIKFDRIKEIATNWDWGLFNPPCVSFRDGMYNIIDGQNTVAAAKMRFGSGKEIPCKLKTKLKNEAEESKWFVDEIKKGIKQSLETIYNARLLSKIDNSLNNLVNDLNKVGFILKINIPNGKNVISALVTIENIHNNMSSEDFITCFKILKDTWNGDNKSLEASFMNGVVKFYKTFSTDEYFDSKRFIKALSRIEARNIKFEVNRDSSDDKVFVKYAKIMCKHYNKGIGNKLKVSKLDD